MFSPHIRVTLFIFTNTYVHKFVFSLISDISPYTLMYVAMYDTWPKLKEYFLLVLITGFTFLVFNVGLWGILNNWGSRTLKAHVNPNKDIRAQSSAQHCSTLPQYCSFNSQQHPFTSHYTVLKGLPKAVALYQASLNWFNHIFVIKR